MIEVKNLKIAKTKNGKREFGGYIKVIQNIEALMVFSEPDEDKDFICLIIGSEKNISAIFDSYEKAERFYNDFLNLLPDGNDGLKSIDCLDYE